MYELTQLDRDVFARMRHGHTSWGWSSLARYQWYVGERVLERGVAGTIVELEWRAAQGDTYRGGPIDWACPQLRAELAGELVDWSLPEDVPPEQLEADEDHARDDGFPESAMPNQGLRKVAAQIAKAAGVDGWPELDGWGEIVQAIVKHWEARVEFDQMGATVGEIIQACIRAHDRSISTVGDYVTDEEYAESVVVPNQDDDESPFDLEDLAGIPF